MKLLDKLKNALFEEEYVEVEEKPVRKEKQKEKPIAKKMVLPKEEEVPSMEEEDFIDLTEPVNETPQPTEEKHYEEKAHQEEPKYEEKEESPPLYTGGKKKDPEIQMHEYGYEKRKDKKEFTPSPIISPIYGILDKNYKKEDVISKREVRLSSYTTNNRMDFDAVRAKAYGDTDVEDQVFEEELEQEMQPESRESEEDQVLLDIREDQTPTVPKVTVGDAEEYFEDLGLEYNIDYKDASKEKKAPKKIRAKQEDTSSQEEVEENLFDLIDSMYEEKDGE